MKNNKIEILQAQIRSYLLLARIMKSLVYLNQAKKCILLLEKEIFLEKSDKTTELKVA